jgi:hypothetical protein
MLQAPSRSPNPANIAAGSIRFVTSGHKREFSPESGACLSVIWATPNRSDGISELRIDYGPGYRVYIARHELVLLAYGGDKSRQKSDIARARQIAAAWEPEDGD